MKTTFKLLFILCLTVVGMTQSKAQIASDFSMGFNINQTQKDFGLGLEAITPYFANSKVAVKFGFNFKFLEHLENEEITWTPYQNLQVGVRARQSITDNIFVYGEGGLLFLFPNDKFSDESFVFGGYGLFGTEFDVSEKMGFFFEMGGAGTGATAEKVQYKPVYSNGFLSSAGMRFYF